MIEKNETISIIGMGYVGLPLALLADRKGYRVIGIDSNRDKVLLINQKKAVLKDDFVEKYLPKSGLEATADFSRVQESSITIVCVPTPVYDNHIPNLEPIKSAVRDISPYLNKEHLVILESTVNPGVSEEIVKPILEKESGMEVGREIFLVHCPERINPGDRKWNVENINRVIGCNDKLGLKKAIEFYKTILTGKIFPMNSLKEAEACKVVENSFRDINIAFVNELAQSFSNLNIDVVNVIKGASTKPFGFMAHYPGCGVGGHCIPVDPYYLIEYAKKNGFNHDFLSWARRINNSMPKFTVSKVVEGLNKNKIAINGSKVLVLGLSYKANIDDVRESPSFEIIKELKKVGAKVTAFDPYVNLKSSAEDLENLLKNSKAVILATSHDLFKRITPEILIKNKVKVLVDGRNFLDKEKLVASGITYFGIGR